MTATYSLQEVAAEMRLNEEMKDPVRWLKQQIKSGRIRAGRYGRSYRMTQTQIDAATEAFTSSQPSRPVLVPQGGLSAASQKRRLTA